MRTTWFFAPKALRNVPGTHAAISRIYTLIVRVAEENGFRTAECRGEGDRDRDRKVVSRCRHGYAAAGDPALAVLDCRGRAYIHGRPVGGIVTSQRQLTGRRVVVHPASVHARERCVEEHVHVLDVVGAARIRRNEGEGLDRSAPRGGRNRS